MTQLEKLDRAKALTKGRLEVGDFLQITPYSWISVEDVAGEEICVEVKLVAKKKFDLEEALEDWAFACEQEEKKKKAKKTTN